jgi:(2Fe-2S) ferredoxin
VNNSSKTSKQVLICQNRTCRKQGSAQVLAAFERLPVTGVTLMGSSCLGQCGNGPIVLVIPERIWYSAVHPQEVPVIIKQHLQGNCPVKAMLYSKYHPPMPQSER